MGTATQTPDRVQDAAVIDCDVKCPHCKKTFKAVVDDTQPPRLQGAKCLNCKLFVPARIVRAAAGK